MRQVVGRPSWSSSSSTFFPPTTDGRPAMLLLVFVFRWP